MINPSLILLSIAFLMLFAFAEILRKKLNTSSKWTRKIVHSGTGLLTMTFPIVLANHWEVLVLCSSFFTLLILCNKKSLLQSINDVQRKTYGAYLFPVSVYSCFLLQANMANPQLFYVPLLVLAIADPAAAIVGQRFPVGRYHIMGHQKTLVGSIAFASTALLILTIAGFNIQGALTIALLSSLSEALSKDGWDNLTIPMTVALVLFFTPYGILC